MRTFLAQEQRDLHDHDALLRTLDPNVAGAVVQDNYLQSALLSMESMRTRTNGAPFLELVQYLDKRHLNRAAEHMPADDELGAWLATGKGLQHNLLAVILAHTKLDLFDRVLASRIPELPLFQPMLHGYFPPSLAATHGEQMEEPLRRRNRVATVATNAIINQARLHAAGPARQGDHAPDRRAGGPLLRVRRA